MQDLIVRPLRFVKETNLGGTPLDPPVSVPPLFVPSFEWFPDEVTLGPIEARAREPQGHSAPRDLLCYSRLSDNHNGARPVLLHSKRSDRSPGPLA